MSTTTPRASRSRRRPTRTRACGHACRHAQRDCAHRSERRGRSRAASTVPLRRRTGPTGSRSTGPGTTRHPVPRSSTIIATSGMRRMRQALARGHDDRYRCGTDRPEPEAAPTCRETRAQAARRLARQATGRKPPRLPARTGSGPPPRNAAPASPAPRYRTCSAGTRNTAKSSAHSVCAKMPDGCAAPALVLRRLTLSATWATRNRDPSHPAVADRTAPSAADPQALTPTSDDATNLRGLGIAPASGRALTYAQSDWRTQPRLSTRASPSNLWPASSRLPWTPAG